MIEHAIRTVLATFCSTEVDAIFRFSESFERLWESTELQDQPETVVIIWDHLPATTQETFVFLDRYITPLHYGVARNLEQEAAQTVHVIAQSQTTHGSALAELTSQLNLDWLKIYLPTGFGEQSLLKLLLGLLEQNGDSKPALVDTLRSVAVTELYNAPDDHHAVSNILAPLVINGDHTSDAKSKALLAMLRRLGHGIGTLNTDAWHHQFELSQDEFFELDGDPLNVLLVDDYAINHGWAKALSNFLGLNIVNGEAHHANSADNRVRLWVSQSPNDLLSSANLADKFDFKVPQDSISNLDIVLLDLRLFHGQSISTEAEFLDLLMSSRAGQEAADQIADEELRLIEDWIVRASAPDASQQDLRNEKLYIESVVTMLPRVIAISDFSLPIILFSSTQKRAGIEKLQEFKNIITFFAKPDFAGGLSSATVETAAIQLVEAFREAASMCRARRFCSYVLRSIKNGEGRIPPNADIPGSSRPYFEIYTDERGPTRGRFELGGVLARYSSQDAASQFSKQLVQNNLVWGQDEAHSASQLIGMSFLPKRPAVQMVTQTVNELRQLTTQHSISLTCFRFVGNWPNRRCTFDIHDRNFRLFIKVALEGLLFHYLPADADVSIFVGTRVEELSPNRAFELSTAFGLNTDILENRRGGGKVRVYSFSHWDVYELFAQIAQGQFNKNRTINFGALRGATLQYGSRNNRTSDPPRQLHYVADWVLAHPNCFANEFSDGVIDELDAPLIDLVEGEARCSSGQIAIGLFQCYKAEIAAKTTNSNVSSIRRVVFQAVGDYVLELVEEAFHRLASLIAVDILPISASENGSNALNISNLKDLVTRYRPRKRSRNNNREMAYCRILQVRGNHFRGVLLDTNEDVTGTSSQLINQGDVVVVEVQPGTGSTAQANILFR